ncbi:unnamed protein product [Strongylus vulgaris]|uniref:Caveolin n=1 Tax=Strongylus vulgaris TaxID=40348 RepID=A0A3P7LX30_STRVU|nr:unnamed protein product [Strongylus vulgaris]
MGWAFSAGGCPIVGGVLVDEEGVPHDLICCPELCCAVHLEELSFAYVNDIHMSIALLRDMSSEQDKPVELEQVPLKSDTDAPAGTVDETATVENPPVVQKKTWFFKKTTKKVIVEEPTGDEEKTVEEKPKQKCWWGKHKTEEEQKDDHISIGIDLVNRDEKAINEHVRFGFEDIFAEADTQHSWDCVWRLVFKVFT